MIEIERPPLKYNGGKWRLKEWINSFIPEHRTYVEPCFGGGGVFWGKSASKFEVLNDIDSLVTNFYEILREKPRELIRKIHFTPYSEDSLRTALTNLDIESCKINKAYHFYVACWMSLRANDIRKSTVDFRIRGNVDETGGHNPAKLFSKTKHLYKIAKRLKDCTILNHDIKDIIQIFDSKDSLFYIDLPYIGESRNTSKLYNHEFTSLDDHSNVLELATKSKGMFIFSHYLHNTYDSILGNSGYEVVTKNTLANSFSNRTKESAHRMEALYISPSASNRLHPKLFSINEIEGKANE